jgi:hypothetical protein
LRLWEVTLKQNLRLLAMFVSGYFAGLQAAEINVTRAVTHVLFETGDEKLRLLEEKVYVASGRFIVEAGKHLVVEYLISEVGS